jgi:heme/copper-type cytochrome/quinol oxidase subunit 3
MRDSPRYLDVSGLTDVPYDHDSTMWWGTLGFIIIEGFTLVLSAASYFYLRLNELSWPPGRTPNPDVLLPTASTVFLLLVIVPMIAADRAARRMDRAGVIRGLVIATVLTVPAVVLRWLDLLALNVAYDAHAYGSIVWTIVLLHYTLIIVDLFETGALAWLFIVGRAQKRHHSDVIDATLYQIYLSIIWVPLYLIVYWGPRLL